jgi:hypothetical protein
MVLELNIYNYKENVKSYLVVYGLVLLALLISRKISEKKKFLIKSNSVIKKIKLAKKYQKNTIHINLLIKKSV